MPQYRHGGRIVAEHLKAAGISHLFTLCGGHISPILVDAKALGIQVVDVRHEASAVFAADAMARLTGRPGVAAVTAGPGVTNTITALKNAQMAQSPLVLIGGATPTVLKNRGSLQDIDQLSLTQSLVKWQTSVRTLAQLDDAMAYALRVAAEGVPGPVFVEAPIDLLYPRDLVHDLYADQAGLKRMKGPVGQVLRGALDLYLLRQERQPTVPLHPRVQPLVRPAARWHAGRQLGTLVKHLKAARKPALVLGSQVLVNRTREQAAAIADAVARLGMPTWTGGMARGLLGAQHELLFRHHRSRALAEADLVIVCGFPLDFRLKYGRGFGKGATLVSVNLSLQDLLLNRKPTVPVLAHPGDFLVSLADREPGGNWKDWLMALREREESREAEIDAQAAAPSDGVNPLQFFRTLDSQLGDEDILVVDGGDFVATGAYTLRPRGPLAWLDPGVYGTLGVGGGFALGALSARPGTRLWLIYGDGSSAYSLAEFDTYRRLGLAPIAIVGCDASWRQIAREQVEMLGDGIGTELRNTDYHLVAEGYGGHGILVEHNHQIPEALEQAIRLSDQGTAVCINLRLGASEFRKGSISM